MFQTIVLITATAATVLQFYTLVRPNWSKEAKASSEVSHLGKSYGGLWYRCYTRKYKGDFSCDNYTSPFFTLEGLLFMRILYTLSCILSLAGCVMLHFGMVCNKTVDDCMAKSRNFHKRFTIKHFLNMTWIQESTVIGYFWCLIWSNWENWFYCISGVFLHLYKIFERILVTAKKK